MRRVRAVMRKEFLHLRRDPRSLAAAVGLPVILLLLYGYAVDFDLRHLPFYVVDQDRSAASRRLSGSCAALDGFALAGELASAEAAEAIFTTRRARCVLVIPPGFERDLRAGRTAPVQVLIDGADGATAAIAQSYAVGAVERVGRELVEDLLMGDGVPLQRLAPAVEPRLRVLYNPDLESRQYLIPGLVGVILMLMAALLTSGVIVRERERGSFELLAASPISPPELLLGKLLPYLILGAFDVVLTVGLGWWVFGVVPRGNLLLLFVLALVFVSAALALGLFFSCVARTQQTAMFLAFVATVVPTMILSGFAFPIRNMPWPLQKLALILPATHFMPIVRGIVLKGVGLDALWRPAVVLLALTLLLIRLAVGRFQKRL